MSIDARIVDAVLARSTSKDSAIHGVDHWQRVIEIGRELASHTPGADAEVVALFGLFHDALREDDGADPEHGPRAGALAEELRPILGLDYKRVGTLSRACDMHADGFISDDATVGVCWDADRLELTRPGVERKVHPAYLSTQAGLARLGVPAPAVIETTAPAGMVGWHYSPAWNRAAIAAHGLRGRTPRSAPFSGHWVFPAGVYVFRRCFMAAHQALFSEWISQELDEFMHDEFTSPDAWYVEHMDIWLVDLSGLPFVADPWPELHDDALCVRGEIAPSRLWLAFPHGSLPQAARRLLDWTEANPLPPAEIEAIDRFLLQAARRRQMLGSAFPTLRFNHWPRPPSPKP